MMCSDPSKRHDFVLLFDVRDGNPNGDPDAGNLPRVDPETMHGLVTDVAIKRKIRDYLAVTQGKPMFIQSKVALNTLILEAFQKTGFEPVAVPLTDEERENGQLIAWLEAKGEADIMVSNGRLLYAGNPLTRQGARELLLGDLPEEQEELADILADVAHRLARATRDMRKAGAKPEVRAGARDELCRTYYDIRMFGAVLQTGLNAGQVRGPAQITFARSVDPVVPMDLTITRQARTTTERMLTGTTEMGRKPIIPYGLYRAHGFFNPFLAQSTGVTKEDLDLFWEALQRMFDNDRSASRGEMSVRGLWVFTHEDPRGVAPAHRLFDLVEVCLKEGVKAPRSFGDYNVQAPSDGPLDAEGYPRITVQCLVRP